MLTPSHRDLPPPPRSTLTSPSQAFSLAGQLTSRPPSSSTPKIFCTGLDMSCLIFQADIQETSRYFALPLPLSHLVAHHQSFHLCHERQMNSAIIPRHSALHSWQDQQRILWLRSLLSSYAVRFLRDIPSSRSPFSLCFLFSPSPPPPSLPHPIPPSYPHTFPSPHKLRSRGSTLSCKALVPMRKRARSRSIRKASINTNRT